MQPSIFVSYTHEDASLAKTLATALEDNGARVWIDQGELLVGDSLIECISDAIAEFDFVAALVSRASVGSKWCRKEIALAISKQLQTEGHVTVLPIRVGDVTMPPSLVDAKWMSLDADHVSACAAQIVQDATRHLARSKSTTSDFHSSKPGRVGHLSTGSAGNMTVDEPVKIIGVDTESVGRPSMDQSRGSALYRLPLLLNRVPVPFWTSRFVDTWNHPPAYTTMHRPGIASVQGDRIVLDGTTIEELERYHLTTLKMVVNLLNEKTAEHVLAERAPATDSRREQAPRL
jgi:TIR domain